MKSGDDQDNVHRGEGVAVESATQQSSDTVVSPTENVDTTSQLTDEGMYVSDSQQIEADSLRLIEYHNGVYLRETQLIVISSYTGTVLLEFEIRF